MDNNEEKDRMNDEAVKEVNKADIKDGQIASGEYEQYDKTQKDEYKRLYGSGPKWLRSFGKALVAVFSVFPMIFERIRFALLPKEYREKVILQEEAKERKFLQWQKKENAMVANKKMEIIKAIEPYAKQVKEAQAAYDEAARSGKLNDEIINALKNSKDTYNKAIVDSLEKLCNLCHETGKEFNIILSDGGALRFSRMEGDVEICYSNAPKERQNGELSYLFGTSEGTATYSRKGEWLNGHLRALDVNNIVARIEQHGGINTEIDSLNSRIQVEQVNPFTGKMTATNVQAIENENGVEEVKTRDADELTKEDAKDLLPAATLTAYVYENEQADIKAAVYEYVEDNTVKYGVTIYENEQVKGNKSFESLQDAHNFLFDHETVKGFNLESSDLIEYKGHDYETVLKDDFNLILEDNKMPGIDYATVDGLDFGPKDDPKVTVESNGVNYLVDDAWGNEVTGESVIVEQGNNNDRLEEEYNDLSYEHSQSDNKEIDFGQEENLENERDLPSVETMNLYEEESEVESEEYSEEMESFQEVIEKTIRQELATSDAKEHKNRNREDDFEIGA